MNIKKGDTVLIISGKDKGKKGKVQRVFIEEGRISVDGVNTHKKHRKPKKAGEKGQTMEVALPIAVSNAMLICRACGKATRVSRKMEGEKKMRVCKKCQGFI